MEILKYFIVKVNKNMLILNQASNMERCWSGRTGSPGKRVYLNGTAGSNPALSAGTKEKRFSFVTRKEGIAKAWLLRVAKQHIEPRFGLKDSEQREEHPALSARTQKKYLIHKLNKSPPKK